MERRKFIQIGVVTALAAQGKLPLLGASWGDPKRAIFTEPAAIEPITGYLPRFTPTTSGDMKSDFMANYKMIRRFKNNGSVAINQEIGDLELLFSGNTFTSVENRVSQSKWKVRNTVNAKHAFKGEYNVANRWSLESRFFDKKEQRRARLDESGSWDGRAMTVQNDSWTNSYRTGDLLIARYALLPLLASGVLKNRPLVFDMIEDCSLRRNQTLKYAGEITVPVSGGAGVLDSYAQTGYGSVPTHYLVDKAGRVQLITMQTVNWALTALT